MIAGDDVPWNLVEPGNLVYMSLPGNLIVVISVIQVVTGALKIVCMPTDDRMFDYYVRDDYTLADYKCVLVRK